MGAPTREIGCHTRPRRRSAPETAEGYPAVVAPDSGAVSPGNLHNSQDARASGPAMNFGDLMRQVAPLLGYDPNKADRKGEARYRPHGSICVDFRRGLFAAFAVGHDGARRMTSLALMPSSAARVLAGLTQAQLARQVGPTVDEAGVPRGCTFPLVCALDDDAQRLDRIDRFPVGDLIIDENRWRRAIV